MPQAAASAPRAPLSRILYVEDDERNQMVVRLHLESHFHVVTATTDVEACAILAREGASLHAVLLDVELQGSMLDGVALATLIRGRLPEGAIPPFGREVRPLALPVIFITAHGARVTPEVLAASGADRVLAKPIDFARLRMALSTIRLDRSLWSFQPANRPR